MKVLDVYSKKDLDMITYNGKTIKEIMDNFFLKFPRSYRENYDKNIESLEMFRVDEMQEQSDSGEYFPSSNVLMFKSFAAIPHEMMHMASTDRENRLFAFYREGEYSLIEDALGEGMTEYLSCIAKDGEPDAYFFEFFVASMLSTIDGIFKPFFIPSYDNFISLFPNKRDICSLLYALDFYHESIKSIDDNSSEIVIDRIGDSVKSVIDSMIDIELSFNNNDRVRKAYAEKFMDLIANPDLDIIVGDVCEDYLDYAYHEVKKRILGRKR